MITAGNVLVYLINFACEVSDYTDPISSLECRSECFYSAADLDSIVPSERPSRSTRFVILRGLR